MTHVCNLNQPWPTGHPLPAVDPARLTGPEPGTFMLYQSKYQPEPIVVRVIEQSYVWSPGECRHGGGYRHYDWSVIEEGPNRYRAIVVNDSDLSPLPEGGRVVTTYSLRK